MEHVNNAVPYGTDIKSKIEEDIDTMCKPHVAEGLKECFETADSRLADLLAEVSKKVSKTEAQEMLDELQALSSVSRSETCKRSIARSRISERIFSLRASSGSSTELSLLNRFTNSDRVSVCTETHCSFQSLYPFEIP